MNLFEQRNAGLESAFEYNKNDDNDNKRLTETDPFFHKALSNENIEEKKD